MKLLAGQVHGNRDEWPAASVPQLHLSTGFTNRPVTNIVDHAGLLGQRDKYIGCKQPFKRVLPANQSLYPDHSAVQRTNLRLIVQHHLIALQRFP
ncbi:hypothetical protein D3C74_399060 [compost metagenome]